MNNLMSMMGAVPQNGGGASAPSGILGTGLAQGAADAMRLHPVWKQAVINGDTDLQFPDWLREQGIENPVVPK